MIKTLEYFNAIGFVHGDINRKNIIYTNEGFMLIDYEPSLKQVKNNIKQFMVTQPYISKLDLQEDKITIRTDKLGFFYFILRVIDVFTPGDIVKLSKTLDHKKFLKFDESFLEGYSYRELLDKAYVIEPSKNPI